MDDLSADRKKPGVAFWATVVLIVLLLYPLSFGPACWVSERSGIGSKAISVAYQPMLRLWMRTRIGRVVSWYALVGTTDGSHAINTVDGAFVINWAYE